MKTRKSTQWNFVCAWLGNPLYTCALCLAKNIIFISNAILNTLLFHSACFLNGFLRPKTLLCCPGSYLDRTPPSWSNKALYRLFEKVTDKLKPWFGGTTPSQKKIGTLGLRSTDFKLRPFHCNQ